MFADCIALVRSCSFPALRASAGTLGRDLGFSPQLSGAKDVLLASGLDKGTLRQIVHVSVGGEVLRLRLSNAFGKQPLRISAYNVALSLGGSKIKVESGIPVTFQGSVSVTIAPGELKTSDPVAFTVAPLSDLALTMTVASVPKEMTVHSASRETSYFKVGTALDVAEFTAPVDTDHWYFLNGLDVAAAPSSKSVVAFGDSITDGYGSTPDGNDRWPDNLARRLQANQSTANIGVLNEGISGNRLLKDGTGPKALSRFEGDAQVQSGVRWLILLEGINDIGSAPIEEQPWLAKKLIAAHLQMIQRAHTHGIRVIGATLLPYEGAGYFSLEGEAVREKLNTWIRTSRKFDGVIDFDAATRDPQHPTRLSSKVDSGDHLHPSAAGYRKMADAIDLNLFDKQ